MTEDGHDGARKDRFGQAIKNRSEFQHRSSTTNEKDAHKVSFIDLLTNNKTSLITFHNVESHKEYNAKEWYECPELKDEIYSANISDPIELSEKPSNKNKMCQCQIF